MKKILLLMILLIITTNAQTNQLTGNWLMVKAEKNGKTDKPCFITTFKENGKMEVMEMEVGTWDYSKVKNTITMHSPMSKNFNGEGKILELTDKKLIVDKDGTKITYYKIDVKAAIEANKQSKLKGVWKIKNPSSDTTSVIKFEEPDLFILVEASDGITDTRKGTWLTTSNNSVLILTMASPIKGKFIIKELTDKKLVLEQNDKAITAIKQNKSQNKIERLSFKEEEFPEDNENQITLPWMNFEEMLSYLSNVKQIQYRSGKLLNETNTIKYNTIFSNIKTDIDKGSVNFTNFTIMNGDTSQYSEKVKGHLQESFNNYFPEKELWPNRLVGQKTITVPAGTFDCTVIEGFDGDKKVRYYMINNKPGIYAEIITEDIDLFGKVEYLVRELEKIIEK